VVFGPRPTTAAKKAIHFYTEGSGALVRHWEQLVPQLGGGTWISFGLYSSTSAQIADINAHGNPGIISGPNEGSGYGVGAVYANVMPIVENMSFLNPFSIYGLSHGAANFFGCANQHAKNNSWGTIGVVPGTYYTSPGLFATGLSIGWLMPANGNNDLNLMENGSCQGGYTYGIFFTEHGWSNRLMILYCWSALCVVGNYFGSVGATHAMKVEQGSFEACIHEVYIVGAGSEGIGPIIDIGQLQTESGTPNIDGNSSGALMAAEGEVKLTGLFTEAGVYIAQPTGIELRNGRTHRAIKKKTANFTCNPIDRTLICDTTSGAITASIPSADVNPVQYSFKNLGSNNLVLDPLGSQTINVSGTAATTVTLTTGQSLTIQSMYDGTAFGWYSI
jgi:hypothetical protein